MVDTSECAHYIRRMEWVRPDGYLVSDDRERFDIGKIHRWLSEESYWAAGRSFDLVEKSIRGSITFGCFTPDSVQVGVTRLITDGASLGILSDVFVDKTCRGLGLGKFLVDVAVNHPEAVPLKRILLCTDDAHRLYEQFGFSLLLNPERWMEYEPKTLPPRRRVSNVD